MAPTRVLLMARELNVGGSERQMTEIARFLDPSRFEPRIGCFLPGGIRAEEVRAAGVPLVEFPVRSFKSPSAIAEGRHLAAYIRAENIALVHTFDYPLNVFAIPVTRWFTGAVAVASQRSHRGITPWGYRGLLRVTDRIAHATVVNCQFLRKHLVEEEGVPADKIEICYNGIDLGVFRPGESARPPVLEGASLVIGVVCGLSPWKGLMTLMDAFASVHEQPSGLKLLIVGSGVMLEPLRARARELGVFEHCVFEPATTHVPEWLRAIDIFVLPSLSEALSNALMEAMACGCCAVASDVGGNPELIEPGKTGMLFEPGNAESLKAVLIDLIADAELRRRLAETGLRFIHDSFSIRDAARRMGDVYSDLLTRHGQAPVASPEEAHTARRR